MSPPPEKIAPQSQSKAAPQQQQREAGKNKEFQWQRHGSKWERAAVPAAAANNNAVVATAFHEEPHPAVAAANANAIPTAAAAPNQAQITRPLNKKGRVPQEWKFDENREYGSDAYLADVANLFDEAAVWESDRESAAIAGSAAVGVVEAATPQRTFGEAMFGLEQEYRDRSEQIIAKDDDFAPGKDIPNANNDEGRDTNDAVAILGAGAVGAGAAGLLRSKDLSASHASPVVVQQPVEQQNAFAKANDIQQQEGAMATAGGNEQQATQFRKLIHDRDQVHEAAQPADGARTVPHAAAGPVAAQFAADRAKIERGEQLSRKLLPVEQLLIQANVRIAAAVCWNERLRSREALHEGIKAALMSHHAGYVQVRNSDTLVWERNDGTIDLSVREVVVRGDDLEDAIGREFTRRRDPNGPIDVTLLIEGAEAQEWGRNGLDEDAAATHRSDVVRGVIFNASRALMDGATLKGLVEGFIRGLDGGAGPMLTEPPMGFTAETMPELFFAEKKFLPDRLLPLLPQSSSEAEQLGATSVSSVSSLSSSDFEFDRAQLKRMSKEERKAAKALEKRELKLADDYDEGCYQIEKEEYREYKAITKSFHAEFDALNKQYKKLFKTEHKELKARYDVEKDEAAAQDKLAKKAQKWKLPAVMPGNCRSLDAFEPLPYRKQAPTVAAGFSAKQTDASSLKSSIHFLTADDICGYLTADGPKLAAVHAAGSVAHSNRDVPASLAVCPDVHAIVSNQVLGALQGKAKETVSTTSLIAASLAVGCVARAHARGILSKYVAKHERIGISIGVLIDLREDSAINGSELKLPRMHEGTYSSVAHKNFLNYLGSVTVGIEFDAALFKGKTSEEFVAQYDVVDLAQRIFADINTRVQRGEAHRTALALASGLWNQLPPQATLELVNYGMYAGGSDADVTLGQACDPGVFKSKVMSVAAWGSNANCNMAASVVGELDRQELMAVAVQAAKVLHHASLF